MLLADRPDLHVFMLRRTAAALFAPSAHVFPGGAVDAGDRDPRVTVRCMGLTDAEASAAVGSPTGGLGLWVAAIREAFEEAGVLLAHRASGEPVGVRSRGDGRALEAARRALCVGERSFLDIVEDHDLVLDVGALALFAHWITPVGAPRRFDTWFFATAAPSGHTYRHDDGETVDSEWARPRDVLGRAHGDEVELIEPTARSLGTLASYATASDFLDAARAAPGRAGWVPDGHGERVPLPGDDPGTDDLHRAAV